MIARFARNYPEAPASSRRVRTRKYQYMDMGWLQNPIPPCLHFAALFVLFALSGRVGLLAKWVQKAYVVFHNMGITGSFLIAGTAYMFSLEAQHDIDEIDEQETLKRGLRRDFILWCAFDHSKHGSCSCLGRILVPL